MTSEMLRMAEREQRHREEIAHDFGCLADGPCCCDALARVRREEVAPLVALLRDAAGVLSEALESADEMLPGMQTRDRAAGLLPDIRAALKAHEEGR